MSESADRFSAIFRDEHRSVRDGILELIEAFRNREPETARALLDRVAALSGPHFRYEEEVMYPGLVQIFGQRYIDRLFREHDDVIRFAERLVDLASQDTWSDADVDEAATLCRDILPHVSDCDGLSLMVERIPESDIQAIFDAREKSLAEGLDLLRWARDVRGSAVRASA